MAYLSSRLIAFYCRYPFHRHILERAYRHSINLGLNAAWMESADELPPMQPDIVVYANAVRRDVRAQLPRTVYVWTRHGFSNKNSLAKCLRQCDIACVSSSWVRRRLALSYVRPMIGFWVTGGGCGYMLIVASWADHHAGDFKTGAHEFRRALAELLEG